MPDKIKVLYEAVSKDYDIGTYDEFSKKLSDPNKRKAFYDGVGKEYELGEYKDFESKITTTSAPVTSEPVVKGAATSFAGAIEQVQSQKGVSIQPEDLRLQQEKQAAAKQESQAKKLRNANKVYEVSQGTGTVAKVRAAADMAERTTVKTLAPVVAPSYLNIPGRVGAEVLSAASKLGSTIASIGREANYTKDTGLIGAPALYDENGEKTEYAKKIGYSDDFLGKMVLGANGLTDDARVVLKNTTLPNTFMGRGLTSVTGMAPDLIAVAAGGGSSVLLEKGAAELSADAAAQTFTAFAKKMALNPFAKVMGLRGFSEAYNATEERGGDVTQRVIEGGKEAAHGMREGAMMELYGFGAGEFGKSASTFLKETGIVKSPGAWTNAMTHTAGNILVFGGQPLLAGDKTGAESGAFIGALFGFLHGKTEIAEQRRLDKQIKSINPELSLKDAPNIILDITHANRITNLYKATPEAVKTAYESKMSADDMNAQALEYGKRALAEGDPAIKKQLMVTSDTFRKSADIKRSVENIVEFRQDWHDFIEGSDRMTADQKTSFKEKVDMIANEYSPIEQHKKSLTDVISPLEARQQELKDAVASESDPVRKAERQAELDANKEQLSAHQAELADIVKRQATGHIKVDESGKIVKLKTPEEYKKESEDTDKKILKFQSTTGLKVDPIDNIPPIVTRVFEWLDSKVPAVDPAALKEASDWVYGKYKELSAMKKSDSRLLTIEQIDALQKQLGKDIDLLERHKNKYTDGEPTTELPKQTTSGTDGKTTADQETAKTGAGADSKTTQERPARTIAEVESDQKALTQEYHKVLKERGLYDQAKDGKAPKGAVAAAKLEAERRYGKSVFDLKAEREAIEKAPAAEVRQPDQANVQAEDNLIGKYKNSEGESVIVRSQNPDGTYEVQNRDKTNMPSESMTAGEIKKELSTKEPAEQLTDKDVAQSDVVVEDGKPVEVETPDGDKIPINHRDMRELREELELEPMEKEGTTVEAILKAAVKSIKAGYNVPRLIRRIQTAHNPSAQEQAIIGLYIEALNKRNNEAPSGELLNAIDEATEALFAARSRIALSLGVTANLNKPKNDLTNYLILEQKAMGVKKIKDKDLETLKKEFEKGEQARIKAEEAYARAEQEAAIDPTIKEAVIKEATRVIEKMKETLSPSKKDPASRAKKPTTDADYSAQRAQIKADMLAALKKANKNTYASIPLAPQLIAIAPHVLKLVKSYVEQGITKLDDVVRKLDDDINFQANGLTQDDIHDIIIGKYNQKQRSRSSVAQAMADVKTEARLLRELSKLQSKPEPKQPVPAQVRSERIEELKREVKEARKKNKEDFPDEYDKQSVERRTKQLKERAAELEGYLKNGGFAPDKPAPRKAKLDAEGQKAEDEYIAFLKESNRRRDKYKFENQSRYDQYMHYATQALGLRRLAQTSLDWSMPFRQVILPTLNPRHWGIGSDLFKAGGIERMPGNIANSMNLKSWSAMAKNTFSQKNYDRMMYHFETSDAYKQMVADKVTFNSLDALENKYRNEDFRTSFVYKIPDAVAKAPLPVKVLASPLVLLVKTLEASQRAADSFVNVARYELYLRGENNLIRSGVSRTADPEAYKDMAKWVMNMTGRGNFMSFLEAPQAQTILGNTFYGARLMASRFNMLNPKYYAKMPAAVRYEAIRDIMGYVTTFSILALGAQQAGFTVSLNPDEADFLKFKMGDKRFDMTGGVGQYVRTGLRLIHALYNVASPAVSSARTEKYGAFAAKSAFSFFDYKLAPNASYALNAIRGKDALGNTFDPKDFFEIYPMYFDDIHKGIESGDMIGTAAIVGASFVGIGAQTYSNKDERKTPDMKLSTITDRGAEYDMKQNGLLDERKKYYNEFLDKNGDRIKSQYKKLAKSQASRAEAAKKSGLSEEQLQARFPAYFMTDKDIDNKVSDLAVTYSKRKILQKYKKLKIAE